MKRADIKKLDAEFRKLVRTGKPCMKCGSTKKVQGSHVLPVSTCGLALRWSFLNCIPLCYRCHIHWWHKNPLEARDWFAKTFGQKRLDALYLIKRQTTKHFTPELVRLSWSAK